MLLLLRWTYRQCLRHLCSVSLVERLRLNYFWIGFYPMFSFYACLLLLFCSCKVAIYFYAVIASSLRQPPIKMFVTIKLFGPSLFLVFTSYLRYYDLC